MASLNDIGGEDEDCGPEDAGAESSECDEADSAIAERGSAPGVTEDRGATISMGCSLLSMSASTASSRTGGMATSRASLLLKTCLASRCSMSRSKMLDSSAADAKDMFASLLGAAVKALPIASGSRTEAGGASRIDAAEPDVDNPSPSGALLRIMLGMIVFCRSGELGRVTTRACPGC